MFKIGNLVTIKSLNDAKGLIIFIDDDSIPYLVLTDKKQYGSTYQHLYWCSKEDISV